MIPKSSSSPHRSIASRLRHLLAHRPPTKWLSSRKRTKLQSQQLKPSPQKPPPPLLTRSSSHQPHSSPHQQNHALLRPSLSPDAKKASHDRKKSIWNWNPIRAIARIRRRRLQCVFIIHINAVENLPSDFNGLLLVVQLRRKGFKVQTMPSRVFDGVANFDETFHIKANVYSHKNGSNSCMIDYIPKQFRLSVVALDASELELGSFLIDLSGLLPRKTYEFWESDKPRGGRDTNFHLIGKAKGGIVVATFQYKVFSREVSSDGNRSARFHDSPLLRALQGLNSLSNSTHGTPCISEGPPSPNASEVDLPDSASLEMPDLIEYIWRKLASETVGSEELNQEAFDLKQNVFLESGKSSVCSDSIVFPQLDETVAPSTPKLLEYFDMVKESNTDQYTDTDDSVFDDEVSLVNPTDMQEVDAIFTVKCSLEGQAGNESGNTISQVCQEMKQHTDDSSNDLNTEEQVNLDLSVQEKTSRIPCTCFVNEELHDCKQRECNLRVQHLKSVQMDELSSVRTFCMKSEHETDSHSEIDWTEDLKLFGDSTDSNLHYDALPEMEKFRGTFDSQHSLEHDADDDDVEEAFRLFTSFTESHKQFALSKGVTANHVTSPSTGLMDKKSDLEDVLQLLTISSGDELDDSSLTEMDVNKKVVKNEKEDTDSFDYEADLIAENFLHLLEGEANLPNPCHEKGDSSSRRLLLKGHTAEISFQEQGNASLSSCLVNQPFHELDDKKYHAMGGIEESRSLDIENGWNTVYFMEAGISEMNREAQMLQNKKRAKMLDNAETPTLMQAWRLDERAFQISPSYLMYADPLLDVFLDHAQPKFLGDGALSGVLLEDGCSIRTFSISHSLMGSLIMQFSEPSLLPSEMGSNVVDILKQMAAGGLEKMALQVLSAMPLKDIAGKTVQHIALGDLSATRTSIKRCSPLSAWNTKRVLALENSISNSTPNKIDGAREECGNSRKRINQIFEKLAVLAAKKVEALVIEGLKIQADMSGEAPYSVEALLSEAMERRQAAKTRLTGYTAPGKKGVSNLDYLLVTDGPSEDYMKLNDVETCMDNMVTLTTVLQLHDSCRNNEPLGGPMMLLIQAERIIHAPSPESVNVGSTKENSKLLIDKKGHRKQNPYKITGIHLSGLKAPKDCTQKIWGSQKHLLSASRWLHDNRNGLKMECAILKPHISTSNIKGKDVESLWSISARVSDNGNTCGNNIEAIPYSRNPDIIFVDNA